MFVHKLFLALFIWAVWMYFSQKYLHLSSSKTTYYSSGVLSMHCFNLFGVVIGILAGSVRWWQYRVATFSAEVKEVSPAPAEKDAFWLEFWVYYVGSSMLLYYLILHGLITGEPIVFDGTHCPGLSMEGWASRGPRARIDRASSIYDRIPDSGLVHYRLLSTPPYPISHACIPMLTQTTGGGGFRNPVIYEVGASTDLRRS